MNFHATLLERYGGMENVSRIVIALYDKVAGAPELSPYFEATDMRALIEHQSHFVASVMGGPATYSDEELRAVHAGRGIDDAAFDVMMGLFRQTLLEFRITEDHADLIVGEMQKRRPFVAVG